MALAQQANTSGKGPMGCPIACRPRATSISTMPCLPSYLWIGATMMRSQNLKLQDQRPHKVWLNSGEGRSLLTMMAHQTRMVSPAALAPAPPH